MQIISKVKKKKLKLGFKLNLATKYNNILPATQADEFLSLGSSMTQTCASNRFHEIHSLNFLNY